MKKSLVALAALAVVGAASAQVSITGTTSFSYAADLTGVKGIDMSDNSIFLGDTEDLGGGTKLIMSTGFDAGGKNQTGGTNSFGEASSLTVSGGFGSVKISSQEFDSPLANADLSGASLYTGLSDSNAVGLAKQFGNGITYSLPTIAGFTGALTYTQVAGQFPSSLPVSALTKVIPSLTYAAGPLTAYIEDAVYNASYTGTSADPVTVPSIYATYDLGAAKVAAGWTKPSNDNSTVILGLSVPVGAVTFGLSTASYQSAALNNGTSTFTAASVGYALSKRTSLKASFATISDSALNTANNGVAPVPSLGWQANTYGVTNNLNQNCEYRVGIYHSF